MSLELVLWAPLLVVLVMLVIAGFRLVQAREDVSAVANAAARATSLSADPTAADATARSGARQALHDSGRSCTGMTVSVSGGEFRPGGAIRVTVTCRADLSDLVGFGLPGSRTFRKTAVVPIEEHRDVS